MPLSLRQHKGSVSTRAAADGEYNRMGAHSARRRFLAWVEEYLRSSIPVDPKLARALRLAQAPYAEEQTPRRWLDRRALSLQGGAGASAAASGGRSTVWGASASWRPRAWPR